MPPRRRKKKPGMMREDAARDRMRDYGFQERVINASIKEVLELYGEDQWFLIEDESYAPLLTLCLEKQAETTNQLAENQNEDMDVGLNEDMAEEEQQPIQLGENQNEEMAVGLNEELAEEEQQPLQLAGEEQGNHLVEEQEEEKEQEQEQDRHVEDGRDQTDELSVTSEEVMEQPPAAFILGEASAYFAQNPVEGAENHHCGWLSEEEEEEEMDPKEVSDGDDDELIQLTPEPLCEELEELLREVRGQKKRKRETRWDK